MSETVNDQEKILKVISKAILGGWDRDIAAGFVQILPDMFTDEYPDAKDSMVRSVLLDHEFARAFFGENVVCVGCKGNGQIIYNGTGEECENCGDKVSPMKIWRWHLTQVVILKNLINYYYTHI